jgi:HEAT repeat protein
LIKALADSDEEWLKSRIVELLVKTGKGSIDHLKKELQNSSDKSIRALMADILGCLEAASAVNELIGALSDVSPEVRAEAAAALGKIKDNRAVAKLTEMVMSEQVPLVRKNVLQALGAINDPLAINALMSNLNDPDWHVRMRAVEAFEQLGGAAIPPLLIALEDENQDVRGRAAQALENMHYIEEILEEYGGDKYRPELKRILLLIVHSGLTEPLYEKMNTSGENLKKRLVRLFGEARSLEAAGPLMELLRNNPKWSLKARIIESLGKTGSAEAIPLLIAHLKDREYWVRRSTIDALGMLDAAAYSDRVAVLLDDPDPLAREWSLRALSVLKADRYHNKIEKLLLDQSSRVKSTSLRVMGELGIETRREMVLKALGDESEEVRIEGVRYFSRVKDKHVMNDILRLLPNGSEYLRKEIIGYIKSIRPSGFRSILNLFEIKELSKNMIAVLLGIAADVNDAVARQFIILFTTHADEFLRENAFHSMAASGFEVGEELLEKGISDPSGPVRAAALLCVGSGTDVSFLQMVRALADDPDENVRLALTLAAGASGSKDCKSLVRSMLNDSSLKVVSGAVMSLASLNDEAFLEKFYARKNIKAIKTVIASITDGTRFRTAVDVITERAHGSRNLKVLFLFTKSEREFALRLAMNLREFHDPVMRMRTLEMLKFIAIPDVFTTALGVMKKDPFSIVRMEAMEVVAATGRYIEVISVLTVMLTDPDALVREKAATLLGNYEEPRAVRVLLGVLDTGESGFREAVTTSLAQVLKGDPRIAAEVVKNVPDTKTGKIGMSWLMGKGRTRGSVDYLRKLLDDNDPDVRASAVGALGKFRKKQLIPTLERMVYDTNERVRAAAVNALAEAGGRKSFDIILDALQDIDEFVRVRAAIGLAKLNMKKALPVFKAKAARLPEFSKYLDSIFSAAGVSQWDSGQLDTTATNVADSPLST